MEAGSRLELHLGEIRLTDQPVTPTSAPSQRATRRPGAWGPAVPCSRLSHSSVMWHTHTPRLFVCVRTLLHKDGRETMDGMDVAYGPLGHSPFAAEFLAQTGWDRWPNPSRGYTKILYPKKDAGTVRGSRAAVGLISNVNQGLGCLDNGLRPSLSRAVLLGSRIDKVVPHFALTFRAQARKDLATPHDTPPMLSYRVGPIVA